MPMDTLEAPGIVLLCVWGGIVLSFACSMLCGHACGVKFYALSAQVSEGPFRRVCDRAKEGLEECGTAAVSKTICLLPSVVFVFAATVASFVFVDVFLSVVAVGLGGVVAALLSVCVVLTVLCTDSVMDLLFEFVEWVHQMICDYWTGDRGVLDWGTAP